MFKSEKIGHSEREKEIETKIILEFMRHAEPEPEEGDNDRNRRLTPIGRSQADDKGRRLNSRAKTSLAWSSPRNRTTETAYRTMLANENINPEAELEDIEKAISEQIKVGKKLIIDKKLDFDTEGEIGDQLWEADEKGEFLKWLVNESDKEIIKYPGNNTLTYARAAGNIAEIVKRYAIAGNNFNKIASKTEEIKKFNNQLERYLGTHQGVVEMFIAKVLEKTKGLEERDKFIENLGKGFEYTEGLRIEIVNRGEGQSILLIYKDSKDMIEKIEIRRELLQEIIKEKKELEDIINS